MNSVVSFYDRQIGNRFPRDYDVALQKLKCMKLDEYSITYDNREYPAPPILACKFAKAAGNQHIIALANEDGAIAIQNVNSNVEVSANSEINGRISHFNAIFDLAWKNDDMKLVTASGDHTLRSWVVTESDIREDRLFIGHDRSVKTVAFQQNGSSVFASGGRDSCIYIWDTRAEPRSEFTLKADKVINCSELSLPRSLYKRKGKYSWWCPSRMNSITGLVFQDDNTLISCSASDGTIRCWDLRKSYSVHNRTPLAKYTLPYKGSSSTSRGYTNLLVDHSAVRLYASCLDNVIYCYNISTYSETPVMTYVGHEISNSFYVKSSLSPDSRYLISGSLDEKAYIWNVRQRQPLLTLNGHEAEVTCVAWCQNGELVLVTCSDDSKHKIWRVNEGETPKNDIIGAAESIACNSKSNQKRLIEDEFSSNKKPRLLEQSATRKRLLLEPQTESPNKRARALFETDLSNGNSDVNTLATILEENINENTKNGTSSSLLTSNLPNFVVDGTAPHLHIISPEKQKENKDWISMIRKEKEIRRRMVDETTAGPSSSKHPRLDSNECKLNGSPKSFRTPTRKTSRQSSLDTPPRAESPLSRYFKITTSANTMRDTHCTPPSSVPSTISTRKIM